jgi:hypothetical protein
VQRAFIHSVDNDTVFQMLVLVSTHPIGGKKTFRGVVNTKAAVVVSEAQYVFLFDIITSV